MLRRRVSEFFDSYASNFYAIYRSENNFINNLLNRFFRRSIKLRFLRTIEACRPIEGRSVISVGCGPGHYGITLARMGASYVVGIDFAEAMIRLAKHNANYFGVEHICNFIHADFMNYAIREKFDLAIVMGFMDYIENPKEVIKRVLAITKSKAFFSFPSSKGFLAWQRRLRYKMKCDLFMYDKNQLQDLFKVGGVKEVKFEKIRRDFYVTVVK